MTPADPSAPAPTLSLVVPAYQEEEALARFHAELMGVLEGIPEITWELIYVNDGSTDRTAQVAARLVAADPRVRLINLSRNFGHQAALTAGIDHSRGQAVICLDADLQHPPALIPRMVRLWLEGYEIVYTIRRDPRQTGPLKRLTSWGFYRLVNTFAEVALPPGAADFRLISRRVADLLKHDLKERTRFLRGLLPWMGFATTAIEFTAESRVAGRSKYSLARMLRLALSGMATASTAPLKAALFLGGLCGLFAVVYFCYAVGVWLFTDQAVTGWTSLMAVVTALFAVQFMVLGILGLYVGLIFEEVKGRPVYLVDSVVENDPTASSTTTASSPASS